MGTRFIACKESPVHADVKECLLSACEEDTVVTGNVTLTGTVNASGFSGSFTLPGPMTGTIGFTGTLSGNTIAMSFTGTTHEEGETCRLTGSLSATRSVVAQAAGMGITVLQSLSEGSGTNSGG